MESGRSAARPSASTLPTRAEISCSVGILEGNSLVDNAFAAPGVNGCGLVPLVFDPLVDISAGLPAAAGHNTAIMNGTVMITEARLVEQEAALPELGRCFKAPFTKVEGERRYHGSWADPLQ